MRLLENAPTEEEIAKSAESESEPASDDSMLQVYSGANSFVEQLLSKEMINSFLDHPWHSVGIRTISFSFAVIPPLL